MKKKLIALTLCTAMTLSMTACGGNEPAASDNKSPETSASSGETAAVATLEGSDELKSIALDGLTTSIDCDPIELSLGCSGTIDGTVMGDAVYTAIEEVKAWTNGNFVINFYPGGQLGGDSELIEGTQMGSVDMFFGAPTSQVGLIPELAVLDIGGLYTDVDSVNQVLSDFQEQFEPYYNKVGLHLANIYAPDFRILTSNKPIQTAADLQSLNIRTQENKYHMAFWKELGTNPTPLAFGELYIALQQGMLDAEENPWASIVGAKLCEVQKYIIETNHIPFVSTYVVNKAKYDGMSDAQKQVFDQFILYCEKYQLAGTNDDDARMSQMCQTEYGIEVTPVSEEIKALFEKASQTVIDMMKEELDPAFVDSYVNAVKAAAN